jgi:hypothetical protein
MVLVGNLRAQPVEIHAGDATVVVPPYGRVELPEAALSAGQAAELARRELISVEPITTRGAAAATGRRRARARTRPRPSGPRPKRSSARAKTPKPRKGGS